MNKGRVFAALFNKFKSPSVNTCKQLRQVYAMESSGKDNNGSSSTSLTNDTNSWFNKYQVMDVPTGVLRGVSDRFNGITVDSTNTNVTLADDQQFDEMLTTSLGHWIDEKRRAIWFRVHRNQASWLPILVRNDFYFHHARDEIVMMYRWLPKDEPSAVPPFAHTMVGVGALVINSDNEVLVVSEKNALIKDSWKLPGGYLEMNEELVDAAIREVEEETNIKTRFESVIAIRHAHGAAFNCSDLYIVMKLIPETSEIKKCDREIAKCQWMHVDEYLSHPAVHQTNRKFVNDYLELKANGMLIDCVEETHQIIKRKYQLFFPRRIDQT